MALHSSVSTEAISSVDFKVNQISVKRFVVLCPDSPVSDRHSIQCARSRIDQLCLEPFRHDLLVVRGIWSVKLCIRWFGFRA